MPPCDPHYEKPFTPTPLRTCPTVYIGVSRVTVDSSRVARPCEAHTHGALLLGNPGVAAVVN
eukprot:1079651-Prorocentrum_minimum.AAC.1